MNAACSSRCYVHRLKLEQAALGWSCFGIALGWVARVFLRWGLGRRAQTDDGSWYVDTTTQQENQPISLVCCSATNSCCCAVPSLLLKPGNTLDPGSATAGRDACPSYSSAVGIAIIAATVVLSIAPRYTCSGGNRLCPCASEMPSSYVDISAHCSWDMTQNIGLVSVYTKPIFHVCIPRIARI